MCVSDMKTMWHGVISDMALLDICQYADVYCLTHASTVLSVVLLSICHTRALWQNKRIHYRYFDTTLKGNSSSFLTPTVVVRRRPILLKISNFKVIQRHQKAPTMTHTLSPTTSALRSSNKVQLLRIGSRPCTFQVLAEVCTLLITPLNGDPTWICCFCK